MENDKAKIQKTIEELDQMKNEAVTKAYIQVSTLFDGRIAVDISKRLQAILICR